MYLSAVGFVGAIASSNFWVSLIGVTVALTGIQRRANLLDDPAALHELAAAGGLAFINSIGTMGGFVGPYVMGWLADRTRFLQRGTGRHVGIPPDRHRALVVAEVVRQSD